MNRFQFVEDHKDAYGVKRLCEVIQIARSSFYAWLSSRRRTSQASRCGRGVGGADPGAAGSRPGRRPRVWCTADHR